MILEMKTIGLIGGTSWVSTLEYYRNLNQLANSRLGGSHSCRLVLNSVQFEVIRECQFADDWDGVALILNQAAQSLEQAGADCILICANTLHLVSEQVSEAVSIPLIHLIDALGEHIQQNGWRKVGLLGTKFTMEKGFFQSHLAHKFDVQTITPNSEDRDEVHRSIYEELTKNQFLDSTKQTYIEIIQRLKDEGAEAVILGCTEIPLLVKDSDVSIPILDTCLLHCKAAIEFAIPSLRSDN